MTTFLQCVTKFNEFYCMTAYVYFDILHTSVTQTVPQSIYDYIFFQFLLLRLRYPEPHFCVGSLQ